MSLFLVNLLIYQQLYIHDYRIDAVSQRIFSIILCTIYIITIPVVVLRCCFVLLFGSLYNEFPAEMSMKVIAVLVVMYDQRI